MPFQILKGLFGILVLICLLIFINGSQILSLIFYYPSRPFFRQINRKLEALWWRTCLWIVEDLTGYPIQITGDSLLPSENAILIANHQAFADIIFLVSLGVPLQRLGDFKFFSKESLKYVPGLGMGMKFIGCIFLKRRWSEDQKLIQKAFETFKKENLPLWLVSYIEGTRKTPAKLLASQRYARERGIPPFQHLLFPRTKGFIATIRELRGHVQAVYDVTIAYEKKVPTAWDIFFGSGKLVHLHVRRFSLDTLPQDDHGLEKWVIDRFREKDQRLESLKSYRYENNGKKYPESVKV